MTDRFETLAVHAGAEPDPETGAVVPAIQMSTTFKQDGVGGLRGGFEYGRSGNPTRAALEETIAALEDAPHGVAFASGLAATQTIGYLLDPGDRLLMSDDVYGGTWRLADQVWRRYGIETDPIDLRDLDAVAAAFAGDRPPRMVWIETPSNPLMKVIDISAVARLAAVVGAITVVDNTFATSYLQRPLELGADLVLHSTTKYLSGHSDVVGGFVATSDPTVAARQMSDFGGMISFLASSEEEAVALVARTRVWKLAESLGGVESMIEHPARMTHASTADAPFATPRSLVRLSVGIESVDDLVAD